MQTPRANLENSWVDLSKCSFFYSLKDSDKEMKRQAADWEKIF